MIFWKRPFSTLMAPGTMCIIHCSQKANSTCTYSQNYAQYINTKQNDMEMAEVNEISGTQYCGANPAVGSHN